MHKRKHQFRPAAPEVGEQIRLTVLSFGGGQDSTALLHKYIEDPDFRARYAPGRFLVVMSDTGDEHPETYEHIELVQALCFVHGIEFVLIQPSMGFHYASWQSLRGFYRLKNTVGSKAFPKTCTDKLKIQVIYKFLNDWIAKEFFSGSDDLRRNKAAIRQFAENNGKIQMLIGIAKGEESRVADPLKDPMKWRRESVKMVYPLIELGMDRKACQDYIQSIGQNVPPPSNCMLCPFMSEIELLWLYRRYPSDFAEWVEIERNKLQANAHMKERNLGVWGRKTLPEKLIEAQAKYGHMTLAELDDHKMSHGHCVKSKY